MTGQVQRLRQIVSRARLSRVDDSTGIQRVQVTGLSGARDKVQRVQNFGLSSRPPVGARVIVLAIGGDHDNLVAIAVDDPDSRPKGLAEGETALYNAHGAVLLLDKDGVATLNASKLKINCPVELGADVTFAAKILTALGIDLAQHLHPIAGDKTGVPQ